MDDEIPVTFILRKEGNVVFTRERVVPSELLNPCILLTPTITAVRGEMPTAMV